MKITIKTLEYELLELDSDSRLDLCRILVRSEILPDCFRNLAGDPSNRLTERLQATILEACRTLFHDKDKLVRQNTVLTIGYLGEGAIPLIRKALRDPDDQIRIYAVRAFQKLGAAAHHLIPWFKRIVAGWDFDFALEIAWRVFYEIGYVDDDVINGLVKSSQFDYLRAIGKRAVPGLIQGLQNNKAHVRAGAAALLAFMKYRDHGVISAFLSAIDDPDCRVRRAAIDGFGDSFPYGKVDLSIPCQKLCNIVVSDEDSANRYLAAETLKRFADHAEHLYPILIGALHRALIDDVDWRVRLKAAESLGSFDGCAVRLAHAALRDALRDEHLDVQVAAARALAQLDPTEPTIGETFTRLLPTKADLASFDVNTIWYITTETREWHRHMKSRYHPRDRLRVVTEALLPISAIPEEATIKLTHIFATDDEVRELWNETTLGKIRIRRFFSFFKRQEWNDPFFLWLDTVLGGADLERLAKLVTLPLTRKVALQELRRVFDKDEDTRGLAPAYITRTQNDLWWKLNHESSLGFKRGKLYRLNDLLSFPVRYRSKIHDVAQLIYRDLVRQHQITVNGKTRRVYEKKTTFDANEFDSSVFVWGPSSDLLTPVDAAIHKEMLSLVDEAIHELLSPEDRQILEMKFFDSLTLEEIADQLGHKNPSTIHRRMKKIIRRLRASLPDVPQPDLVVQTLSHE